MNKLLFENANFPVLDWDLLLGNASARLDRHNFNSFHNVAFRTFQNHGKFLPEHKPKYRLLDCLGFGGYGRVYDAVKLTDESPVVLKIINKTDISNWSTTSTKSLKFSLSKTNLFQSMYLPFEIECLLRLRDISAVVKIHDYFEEKTHFAIVMEKFSHSVTLFDLVNGKSFSLSESILHSLFTQLIHVNMQLLARGIVHRDIKPENILVNLVDFSIKLIDFGSAANLPPNGDIFHEFQGTLECMPPEWILRGNYEAEQATAWAIGVTFYFCVFGRYPFKTKAQIVSGRFPLPSVHVSHGLLKFLDACFQINPENRFTLNRLFKVFSQGHFYKFN